MPEEEGVDGHRQVVSPTRTAEGKPEPTLYPQAEVDVLLRQIGAMTQVLELVLEDAMLDRGYYVLRPGTIVAVRRVLHRDPPDHRQPPD